MNKLKKILIPTDFSAVAINAVNYARGIFKQQPVHLSLVYINTPENFRSEQSIREEFDAFKSKALRGAPVHYDLSILYGHLLPELIRAESEQNPDLIIMGARNKEQSDLSLASAFIRGVSCPVVVVPEQFHRYDIDSIVFANDYQPIQDSRAIKPLWEFALEFGAKVLLLHINHKQSEQLVPADHAESTLEYYLESLEHEYVYLSSDDMEVAISHYIKANKVDMLAILTRHHDTNTLKSKGQLVAELAARAEIPVLALC